MSEQVLIVDDELSMREFLSILLSQDGYQVRAAGSAEEALRIIRDGEWPQLILTDMNMPGMSGLELLKHVRTVGRQKGRATEVVVITGFGSTETGIEAMELGAANYIQKPFNNDELRLVVRRALGKPDHTTTAPRRDGMSANGYHFGNLVGSSSAMRNVYDLIRRVMTSRISCMIIGESGTGKEMVARAIHQNGERADKPFVPINCGAIPENLIESELFGHKKGSFTGAIRDKPGLFQVADQGTLFLDEVNSLPVSAQVKLLRVIQERRFTPVGGVEEKAVDVRVLAASNTSLEEAVQQGTFREDLFYRLNVVQIRVPPLRERQEDIPVLVQFFVRHYAEEYGRNVVGFSAEAMQMVKEWAFPGNVRELRNMVERAVALCPGSIVQPADLPEVVLLNSEPAIPITVGDMITDDGLDLDALLAATEQKWLRLALDKANGNRTAAARLLKMSFRSLRYRLEKYNMDE